MPCGCKDRREAIARGIKFAASGNLKQTGTELKFVAKTAAQDATIALRQKTAQIKSRLMRR